MLNLSLANRDMLEDITMEYVSKATFARCTWLILILALSLEGCASTNLYSSNLRITPLNNRNTINLTADDIVLMMRRIGLSDGQILKLGTDMHDSLSRFGAAQLDVGGKVEAIFAVNDGLVYVATRSRGTFIYNAKTGQTITSAKL